MLTRRTLLRRALVIRVRATQGSSSGPACIQRCHFTTLVARIHCSTILCQHISGSSHPRTDGARAPQIQQPTAEQGLCCWLCIRTPLTTRNRWSSPNSRSFAHHSHPHHSTDANTPNSSLPLSFRLARPKLCRRASGGRLNISLEQHSAQAIRVKVFQHTTDRMRLWSFLKLLYQRCVRDQVRARTMSTRGNDDPVSKCLRESSSLHWLRFATCALSFSRSSLSGGRACIPLALASPPRLQSHSVHLSRLT